MYRRDQLKRLAEVYVKETGISASKLSRRIVPSNNRLIGRLLSDQGIWAENAELVSDWFVDNWLPKIPWPAEVPRPNGSRVRVADQVNGGSS
jgi:hypothetical protein